MKTNLWHRRIAIVSAIFLLISATTGLLWAYAIHFYLKTDYQKKKNIQERPSLSSARISPSEALSRALVKGNERDIESVTLTREGGKVVYLITRDKKSKAKPVLIDAVSGEKLSPISDAFARLIAKEYVPKGATVKSVQVLATYVSMTGREIKDVLEITFNESTHPKIILDRNSGANVDEVDGARKLQYWVRKLHQYQFFGTKKELTAIPGLALLFLTITGSMILWRRYKPRKRPS